MSMFEFTKANYKTINSKLSFIKNVKGFSLDIFVFALI